MRVSKCVHELVMLELRIIGCEVLSKQKRVNMFTL